MVTKTGRMLAWAIDIRASVAAVVALTPLAFGAIACAQTNAEQESQLADVHVIEANAFPPLRLNIAGRPLELEVTTLPDVASALLSGTSSAPSKDGTKHELCFDTERPNALRLHLYSSDEFGGSERRITSIFAERLTSASKASANCVVTKLPNAIVSVAPAIWVGTNSKQAAKALGVNVLADGLHGFQYSSVLPTTRSPTGNEMDITTTLRFASKDGKIVAVSYQQLTTN